MDDRAFDRLTRRLARPSARRPFLGAVLTTLAAAFNAPLLASPVQSEACLYVGQRCGKNSARLGGPCRRCCSGYATGRKRQKRCTCRPDGFPCESGTVCCSGNCRGGTCGDRPRCIPLNQLCVAGSICCNAEARCATHTGRDGQLRCCLTTGNRCTTGDDCCRGACNTQSGVCEG